MMMMMLGWWWWPSWLAGWLLGEPKRCSPPLNGRRHCIFQSHLEDWRQPVFFFFSFLNSPLPACLPGCLPVCIHVINVHLKEIDKDTRRVGGKNWPFLLAERRLSDPGTVPSPLHTFGPVCILFFLYLFLSFQLEPTTTTLYFVLFKIG